MAQIQHTVLPDSSLHEVKGAAAASVDTVLVADGAGSSTFSSVSAAMLASDSVTTIKILDANVTTPKLADGAVTTVKIADGAVTSDKLAESAFRRTINTQTGTAYTLQLTDRVAYVRLDNAAANTVTIPAEATVAYENGDQIDLFQAGAGGTTIMADTGVTVNGVLAGSAALAAQFSGATLIKVGTNEWDLVGDHGGVS